MKVSDFLVNKIELLFLFITFVIGSGFIIGETNFAKFGIPIALHSSNVLQNPKLFIFEIYTLFSFFLFSYLAYVRKVHFSFLRQKAYLIVISFLLLFLLRTVPDILVNPILVVRNSSFVWYLLTPILISLLPIRIEYWKKTFIVFNIVVLLTLLWSVFFYWIANPKNVGLNYSFYQYTAIKWSLGFGCYGLLAYALFTKNKIIAVLILITIGLAFGMDGITKFSRTNLLGCIFVCVASICYAFKYKKSILNILFKIIFIVLVALTYGKLVQSSQRYEWIQNKIFLPKETVQLNEESISIKLPSNLVKSEAVGLSEAYRAYLLKDAWLLFAQNPILGIGFKEQVVYRYYVGGIVGFAPNNGNHDYPYKNAPIAGPHNSYLNALARLGILGIFFLLFHIWCLFQFWKEKLYIFLFPCFAGILYAFFNVGLEGPGRSYILLLTIGVALKVAHENEKLGSR